MGEFVWEDLYGDNWARDDLHGRICMGGLSGNKYTGIRIW